MNKCIRFASGYAYQLRETCIIDAPELIGAPRVTAPWYSIYDGKILICGGYAWDGASGPAIDTLNFMRGSLAHDVAYQALREGHLPPEFREPADRMLRRIVLEDGMWAIRAWWVYHAVRLGGGPGADPANVEPDRCAPCDCADCS